MLTLTERQYFPLLGDEEAIFGYQREILKKEIIINQLKGVSVIYDSQKQFAKNIIDIFDDKKVLFVTSILPTQAGKTGTMISIIEQYVERHCIPFENIYLITGLSSKSWKKQVKDRFPNILETQIYHRNDLKDRVSFELTFKKDALIIMDEMHIAARKKQTMDIMFEELSFAKRETMYEKNIKVIEFSATPDGVLKDRLQWGESSKVVFGKPGSGYKGIRDFFNENRIHQCDELCGFNNNPKKDEQDLAKENIRKLGKFIINRYGIDKPKYHIIRTPTGEASRVMMNNFKEIYGDNVDYKEHNGITDEENINDILNIEPKKHTCIFIMELCRCADTINKKYIGVLYERNVKIFNDSAQVQGLPGRMCGYDDTGETVVFANVPSLELYLQHYDSEFTRTDIPWNCNTKNGTYAREDTDSEYCSENGESVYGYRVFENEERYNELEIFTRSHLGGWVPRKNAGKNINELKNHTSNDLIVRHWGLSNKNPRRIALGSDGKWVVWWLKSKFCVD